jgi:FkbM family methyltransferase
LVRRFWQTVDDLGIPGRRALKVLLRHTAPLPREPCITLTQSGQRLLVDPRREPIIDRQIYLFGVYEAATLAVMSDLLMPGDGVLDVGANIGLMTVHAARLVGPAGMVIALEPALRPLEFLQTNVELNELRNVRIVRKGAGAAAARTGLFHDARVGSGGSTLLETSGRPPDELVEVETIDVILAEIPHPALRFMKLDVEGFELEALRGASGLLTGDQPPIICMEYTRQQQNTACASVDLLVGQWNFVPLRTVRNKFQRRYGGLRRLQSADDYPAHDNVYFVPAPRVDEVLQKTSHNL